MLSKRAAELSFKLRGLIGSLFTITVLFFPGRYSLVRMFCGLIILIAGQIVRLWAAGYIPSYRTEKIGAPMLITSGPYALIRNPLYVGNFLIGIGWTFMAGWLWATVFIFVYVALYCYVLIPAEEDFLEKKFGFDYINYKKKVPAIFPRNISSLQKNNSKKSTFTLKKAYSKEVYSIRINFLVTMLFLIRMYSVR